MENVKLGRKVTLDELFDLALFKELHELESGEVQVVLSRLIVPAERHLRSSPRCLTGQPVVCGRISSIRRPNNYLLTSLPADEEGLVANLLAALWINPERSVEGMDIEIGYCLTQSPIL